MVLFNYSTKELTAKIVYYGPGLCGKTTNLEFIYESLPEEKRGRMLSLSTQTDRTLYFDFLPVELGDIRGMKTRVQLYTVPGQVFYDETRRMVLKGVDGVVFVADSQAAMAEANLESFKNLEDNLVMHGLELSDVSMVLQFNKRDLPDIQTVEEMNAALNRFNVPFYEAIATTGIGVHDTLKAISKLVLRSLTQRYEGNASEPLNTPSEQATAEVMAVTPSLNADDQAPLPAATANMGSDNDWECADLENELDQMDASEIQGLLEEVDCFDTGPESSAEETGSFAGGEGETPAAEEHAASSMEQPPGASDSEDLFATPAADDPVSEPADGGDSVWMGAPEGESQDLVPGEATELEATLAAGNESPIDLHDAPPAEVLAATATEAPTAMAAAPSAEPPAERPLSFENFMEQAPVVEPPAPAGTNGDMAELAGDDASEDAGSHTPAEVAMPLAEASDQPALVPGPPEQDVNGDLRVPLRLQLNGHEHTYILTLSLQPQSEDPS
jgi:signal recognition particle receptor subunit beta